MNRIAEELDAKLNSLNPDKAKTLVLSVRSAIEQVEESSASDLWPEGYLEEIAGSFANEPLERASQGQHDVRSRKGAVEKRGKGREKGQGVLKANPTATCDD